MNPPKNEAILNNPWRRLVLDEILPRYCEIYDAIGLGNPDESVVVTLVRELIESDHSQLESDRQRRAGSLPS